jgi:hypothetical protein
VFVCEIIGGEIQTGSEISEVVFSAEPDSIHRGSRGAVEQKRDGTTDQSGNGNATIHRIHMTGDHA